MSPLEKLDAFLGKHMAVLIVAFVLVGITFPDIFSPINDYTMALFAFMTFANSLGGGFREMAAVARRPLPVVVIFAILHAAMPLLALALGSVLSVIVAIFTNIYLIFPAYIHLYGMNWDAIIDICNKVNPYITSIPTFVLFSVVPFNIISGSIIGFITMLLYKKISVPLKKMITA